MRFDFKVDAGTDWEPVEGTEHLLGAGVTLSAR